MLSTQFVQSQTAPRLQQQQQTQDFDSLFLSLSGLSLTETPTTAAPHAAPQPLDSGILAACLFPSAQNVVFGHASFFKHNAGRTDLPTPNEVREEAARQNGIPTNNGATLVAIPSLGLLVKFGPAHAVPVTEAKSLMLLRQHASVPEVFGWRKDGDDHFIYMSLPEGVSLAESWPLLSDDQKVHVCTQLRGMVRTWRRLRQNNATRTRVESVDGTALHDPLFISPAGPFSAVAPFHEWFVTSAMHRHRAAASAVGRVAGSYHFQPNSFFRDDVPVLFTHGALHPRNVVISTDASPRVVALLDWSQAGWYPAYWEWCKARRACGGADTPRDWEGTYLPWILDDDGTAAGIRQWGGTALCHYWDYFVGLMERAAEKMA